MENLTGKEIDTLIEAMEAWENASIDKGFFNVVMDTIFSKDMPEEAREQLKQDREREKVERQQEQQHRKYQSIVLKAKLIAMKENNAMETIKTMLELKPQS